jgi:5-methylcytosine-specific restriction endonuclease McrA
LYHKIRENMINDTKKLQRIYAKTDGYCHVCHKKLSFCNYGVYGTKGAWQIDHSKAKANGGSDHLNNLYAACIKCNSDKGVISARLARAQKGKRRAPYSKLRKQELRDDNTAAGIIIGGIAGSVLGPAGTLIGSLIGGIVGDESSPRK